MPSGIPRQASPGRSKHRRVFGTVTQVLSNRAVNELRVGFFRYETRLVSPITWDNHPAQGQTRRHQRDPSDQSARVRHRAGGTNAPTHSGQKHLQLKDDFMYSVTKGGRHDLTFGGEYGYMKMFLGNCRQCMGILDANNGPISREYRGPLPGVGRSRYLESGAAVFDLATVPHRHHG